MRHRIKKIPNLIHNKLCKSHLLRSDKSTYCNNTYFYKHKLSNSDSKAGISPQQANPHAFSPRFTFTKKPSAAQRSEGEATRARNDGPRERRVSWEGELGLTSKIVSRTELAKLSSIPLLLSSLVLLLVLGVLFSPSGFGRVEKASAAVTGPDPNFTIQLSMGDTLQEEQQLEAGVVGYIANNFTIKTTGAESYSIYLAPDTENNYTDKLIGRDHKQEIGGVGNNVAVDDFANNTWGYGLTETNDITTANNELTYSSMPDGSTPIRTVTNLDDGDDTYKLVFAAKISDDKPADHYQSQAILSVMASPRQVVTYYDGITYMQEMTPEICNSEATPAAFLADGTTINSDVPTKQLIDKRDGKKYWIAKLADGNCWMTQNLDLDLDGVTLKPDDSNVSIDWVSDTGPSTIDGYNSSYYYQARYYDPGDQYCDDGECSATVKNTGHNHHGNLYSWTAATAGAGTEGVTSGDVNDSICPKGWRLPTSGRDNTDSKSFGGLTTAYNVSNDVTGSTILRDTPLYFIYSGYVNFSKLYDAGRYGSYWSSTTNSNTNACDLYFSSSSAGPSGNGYRYTGGAVRCVAQ